MFTHDPKVYTIEIFVEDREGQMIDQRKEEMR
jgi:hypothetical protein